MRNDYITRAKKFVEEIFPYLNVESGSLFQVKRGVVEFNLEKNRAVVCAHGMTRWALISSDYVVKMDYGTEDHFGHCADEYDTYCEAKADGMDYLFAEITPFYCNGFVFYIMPRIRGIGSRRSSFYDVDRWLNYDEIDYLDNLGLFDLHNGNYGWRNNRPVIIDYAARGQTSVQFRAGRKGLRLFVYKCPIYC